MNGRAGFGIKLIQILLEFVTIVNTVNIVTIATVASIDNKI